MELTKTERVMLMNQYRILSHLDPDNKSNYDEKIEVLQSGYKIFYSMLDELISDEMMIEASDLVLQTLSIYRQIEFYKKKNPTDKEIIDHPSSVFAGFDGNHESQYYAFARFVIETQNKYEEQKKYWRETDGLNSHSSMVDKYSRMIEAWKSDGTDYNFSRERILKILNA